MVTDNFYKAAIAKPVFTGYGDTVRPYYLPQDNLTITGYNGRVYKVTGMDLSWVGLFSGLCYDVPNGTTYESSGSTITAIHGVVFGNGDSPVASHTDYALSGSRITNIGATINRKGVSESNGVFTTTAIFTITNRGEEEITITEAGVLGLCNGRRADSTSTTNYYVSTLYDHTVLDTPVTIPAGGVGQVEYTITFNNPWAT